MGVLEIKTHVAFRKSSEKTMFIGWHDETHKTSLLSASGCGLS
jgi:hypothetical protein